MALKGKQDIQTELDHALPFADQERRTLRNLLEAADEAEEDTLAEMQRLMGLIADAEYKDPDLL